MEHHTIEKNLEALNLMTDGTALLQHESDKKHDYSFDDQARGLIVVSRIPEYKNQRIRNLYFNFIVNSRRKDGLFNNYLTAEGKWQGRDGKPETSKGLKDCYGRGMWALTELLFSPCSAEQQKQARDIIFSSLKNSDDLTSPISLALTTISFSVFLRNNLNLEIYNAAQNTAGHLLDLYNKHKDKKWKYPSSKITYCCGRVPQAMILAGNTLSSQELTDSGKESLEFLISQTFENGLFNPIGNKWIKKGEKRTYDITLEGDKQPVEAGVATETYALAAKLLDKSYLKHAFKCFGWFKGENKEKLNLLAENGAVSDAITSNGLSTNQGAEPLLTYLQAYTSLIN